MGKAQSVLLAAMAVALLPGPAIAEVSILASPGGAVGPYLELFDRVRASGERVVIDGQLRLVPGARVEVKPAAPEAKPARS